MCVFSLPLPDIDFVFLYIFFKFYATFCSHKQAKNKLTSIPHNFVVIFSFFFLLLLILTLHNSLS